MKKRIILGIAACALWVLCVCLLTTQVQASQTEDFTYEVHDGKATITGCTWEYNYVIEIPQTVDG